MASFSSDVKWLEAKKVVGRLDWLSIITYYRHIGGTNTFVYLIGEGDKKLIVSQLDDDSVVLLDKKHNVLTESSEVVEKGRKQFSYSEDYEYYSFTHNDMEFKVPIEERLL